MIDEPPPWNRRAMIDNAKKCPLFETIGNIASMMTETSYMIAAKRNESDIPKRGIKKFETSTLKRTYVIE